MKKIVRSIALAVYIAGSMLFSNSSEALVENSANGPGELRFMQYTMQTIHTPAEDSRLNKDVLKIAKYVKKNVDDIVYRSEGKVYLSYVRLYGHESILVYVDTHKKRGKIDFSDIFVIESAEGRFVDHGLDKILDSYDTSINQKTFPRSPKKRYLTMIEDIARELPK